MLLLPRPVGCAAAKAVGAAGARGPRVGHSLLAHRHHSARRVQPEPRPPHAGTQCDLLHVEAGTSFPTGATHRTSPSRATVARPGSASGPAPRGVIGARKESWGGHRQARTHTASPTTATSSAGHPRPASRGPSQSPSRASSRTRRSTRRSLCTGTAGRRWYPPPHPHPRAYSTLRPMPLAHHTVLHYPTNPHSPSPSLTCLLPTTVLHLQRPTPPPQRQTLYDRSLRYLTSPVAFPSCPSSRGRASRRQSHEACSCVKPLDVPLQANYATSKAVKP